MNAPIGSLRSPLPPLWRGKLRYHNPSLPRRNGGGGPRKRWKGRFERLGNTDKHINRDCCTSQNGFAAVPFAH